MCVDEGAGPVTCPEGHVMVTEVGGASRCQEASTIAACPEGRHCPSGAEHLSVTC